MGSNPIQGMDVCRVYSVFVLPCVGSGLARGRSPVQGVLPTVYKIKKLKKRPRFITDCSGHRESKKERKKVVCIDSIYVVY
jgi:hypothetical protein